MQDLPAVIDLARADRRLADAGVEFVAADAFDRVATSPFDLIVCGTFTNLFDLDQVRALLERLRDNLAPGGQVAIVTWLRDRGPVGEAFGVQMLIATNHGEAHSLSDYQSVLAETGYTDIALTEVAEPPIAVIVARS